MAKSQKKDSDAPISIPLHPKHWVIVLAGVEGLVKDAAKRVKELKAQKVDQSTLPHAMITALADPISGQFDKLPPAAVQAEMSMLASMMLDREMIGEIVQIVDRDAVFQADHQIIFDIIVKLYEANRPIDAIIVREELAKRQLLEEVGGMAYLAQIITTIPSAAHGVHYAQIVREKALLRQLIAASNNILRDAYAPHEQADLVLDKAEKQIFDIAQKKVGGTAVHLDSVLQEVFDNLQDKGRTGLLTGFFDLDEKLNGLQNGEMIILAARPSMGKTALAMNMIEGIAAPPGGEGLPC